MRLPRTPTGRRILKWVAIGAIAIGLAYAGLVALVAFTDFMDIPCQDGRWDAERKICIPT